MSKPIKRSKRRRCAYAILIALVAVVSFRNPLVRIACNQLAMPIAGVDLSIDQVRIGWSIIELHGIRVAEPAVSDAIQLEATALKIAITPAQGFRNGVWARSVVVQQPTLHLRFDEAGQLVSKFPESSAESKGPAVIPIGELLVRDASIVVHQVGRETFSLVGMKLIGQFGESIRVRGEMPQVFNGSALLQADLNATSLAGRSKLTIDHVAIDTDQLAMLPLVPGSLKSLGFTGEMSVTAFVEHPEHQLDPRRHDLRLVARLKQLSSSQLGLIANRMDVSVTNQQGLIKLAAIGDPLDSVVNVDLAADLNRTPMSADATLSVKNCDVRQLAAKYIPQANFTAKSNVAATSHVDFSDGLIRFHSSLNAKASDIALIDIPIDDVSLAITADGAVPVSDVLSASGNINGHVTSNGIALADVGKRFGVPDCVGRVRASSEFQIPLERITQLGAYSISANVHTTHASVAGFTLNDSAAQLTVKDSLATFDVTNAIVLDPNSRQIASLAVAARANLAADGELSAAVDVALSPNESLMVSLGLGQLESAGKLHVKGSAQAPLARLSEPETWVANARAEGIGFAFAGERLGDFFATCDLHQGDLSLPAFPIAWRSSTCTLAASGRVARDLSMRVSVNANSVQLEELAQLASRFSKQRLLATGDATVSGNVQLSIPNLDIQRMDLRGVGSATIAQAHFGLTKVGDFGLNWNLDRSGVTATSGSRDFLGGTYAVTATAQELDWTKTIVDGKFSGVQATRLASFAGTKIPLTGVFNGGIQVTQIGSLDAATGRAWIESRGFSVQRIPIEIASGSVSIESGNVRLTSEGKVSRGRFAAEASSNLRKLLEFSQSAPLRLDRIPIIARAELIDFPVDSLAGAVRFPKELRSLRGNVSATIERGSAMIDSHKIFDVIGTVSDVQLNQVRLADRIVGEVTVQPDRIELHRLDGRFADGRLAGRAEVRLSPNPTGSFEISAQRVNLRRLAAAAIQDQSVAGSGTVAVRGKIGQVVSGRADVSLDHILFAGVSIPEARFPVDWSYSQPARVARWQCRAGRVSAGGGKVLVASEGMFGTSLSTQNSLRIERVDSSKLMAGKSFGAGTISGKVTVNAKRARSLKQFAGRFELQLANPEPLQMPVLNQLPTMISFSPPRPGLGEDGGQVEGRIAGGLVHIDRLAIAQSNIQVLLSGNATQQGRLNFDVTVSTQSNGPADQLLSLADSPLMLAAPAPIALVVKANDLMKDRVVHVHVGGLATRPTLRLQPGKQLNQDAVQFFLKNSIGSQATEIASRQNQFNLR